MRATKKNITAQLRDEILALGTEAVQPLIEILLDEELASRRLAIHLRRRAARPSALATSMRTTFDRRAAPNGAEVGAWALPALVPEMESRQAPSFSGDLLVCARNLIANNDRSRRPIRRRS